MSAAPDSYDICRRCYRRLTEADDYDPIHGALCEECKETEVKYIVPENNA